MDRSMDMVRKSSSTRNNQRQLPKHSHILRTVFYFRNVRQNYQEIYIKKLKMYVLYLGKILSGIAASMESGGSQVKISYYFCQKHFRFNKSF